MCYRKMYDYHCFITSFIYYCSNNTHSTSACCFLQIYNILWQCCSVLFWMTLFPYVFTSSCVPAICVHLPHSCFTCVLFFFCSPLSLWVRMFCLCHSCVSTVFPFCVFCVPVVPWHTITFNSALLWLVSVAPFCYFLYFLCFWSILRD